MNRFTRRVLFFLFFLSGCSSLVYQVVWTRMAFASFGIITPVLSVVLSVFMLGLALGSWAGGRFIAAFARTTGPSAVHFYAGAEFLIGLGAFAVPKLFSVGERLLLASGETDSFGYLSRSALVLAASILPWCVCMGATFPLMMAFVRERDCNNTESFSFLYIANVLGAMCGTFFTAVVWIELLGFRHTLWLAAAGNFTIAFVAACLGLAHRSAGDLREKTEAAPAEFLQLQVRGERMTKAILFSTGFSAMAMEVVWSRAFTPVLKTQVYSFAMIVFAYLGATFFGSWVYRRNLRKNRVISIENLMSGLALTAFLPVLANNPKFVAQDFYAGTPDVASVFILLGSICPLCALLGYLTPGLIDGYAAGQPMRAGRAYAINVLGCIFGPLFACYFLLPVFNERHALVLLSVPFFIFWLALGKSLPRPRRLAFGGVICVALIWTSFFAEDFDSLMLKTETNTTIRRDYAASVTAFGKNQKWLLVNGIGMTVLTPITKFMVHLPMAFHKSPPQSALVICFGMGTTYRSALSWNIDTTVVELVPSVTKDFGFFHADAARAINDPNGHMITDDGRRFLKRTDKKFDIIVVDPPPPVQAAGSSLLFSKEFYDLAKQHLKPGGIVQMWFPGDNEMVTAQAVFRSIYESFPYVRGFPSINGWGIHLLASMEPIEQLDAEQLTARMPESAKKDLVEWNDSKDAAAYLNQVLTNEYSIPTLLNSDPEIQVTDDKPFNEYFLIRRLNPSPAK